MTPNAFAGGVAVITGAGAGIGAGLAREAGRLGMTVVVSDVDRERAEKVAGEIVTAGGKAHANIVDVRDADAVEALAASTYDKFGDVRLLINNAGIEMLGLMWELTPAQWRKAMDINVNGIFYGIRSFIPRMIERAKGGKRAAVANLSSVGGVSMSPMMTPYTVSKHAVLSMTECLAMEMNLLELPIDVSVITPGMVRTSIFDDAVVTGTDAAAKYKKNMRDYMANGGMDMEPAARFMFEQLTARKFWVSTQPEMTETFSAVRVKHLRSRSRPQLNPQMRNVFE